MFSLPVTTILTVITITGIHSIISRTTLRAFDSHPGQDVALKPLGTRPGL